MAEGRGGGGEEKGLQWGFCTYITLVGCIKSFPPLSSQRFNTSHRFFENIKTAHVFKYVSFSAVSFLWFSYAQPFVATDLFNTNGGGVEEQVNFNWNCA